MSLHDTHFHLDLFSDPLEVASEIEKNKIYTIAVTNAPSVFHFTFNLASNSKYIRAALGLHPELAEERQNELNLFLSLIDQTRYIGEVGLDNYDKSPANYSIQKKVFENIIKNCADKKNKILSVHSRRADLDVISTIGEHFPGKVILHWYSGSLRELNIAVKFGFYFSVNYAMSSSNNGKKIINAIPNDRLLLETDGPFVEYNNSPSTPLLTQVIVQNINQIKKFGLDCDNLIHLLSNNFKNLLGHEQG